VEKKRDYTALRRGEGFTSASSWRGKKGVQKRKGRLYEPRSRGIKKGEKGGGDTQLVVLTRRPRNGGGKEPRGLPKKSLSLLEYRGKATWRLLRKGEKGEAAVQRASASKRNASRGKGEGENRSFCFVFKGRKNDDPWGGGEGPPQKRMMAPIKRKGERGTLLRYLVEKEGEEGKPRRLAKVEKGRVRGMQTVIPKEKYRLLAERTKHWG